MMDCKEKVVFNADEVTRTKAARPANDFTNFFKDSETELRANEAFYEVKTAVFRNGQIITI